MATSKVHDRRKGREIAFQSLYSLSFAPVDNLEELRQAFVLSPQMSARQAGQQDNEPVVFAWQLVQGVWQNSQKLDDALQKLSHHWRIDRVGKIELTLLRLGLYEIYSRLTPPKVVMNEILAMADQFGATAAKSFLNGILDSATRSAANCSLA